MFNYISAIIVFVAVIIYLYGGTDVMERAYPAAQRSDLAGEERLLSAEELRRYNGAEDPRLYLAILGRVFDVSAGRQHYQSGATYHFFLGKDGSRSFVTGDFSKDSTDRDDILDLSCSELSGLQGWLDTYYKRYIYIGKLVGRHYDVHGGDTAYGRALAERLQGCDQHRRQRELRHLQHPPCNVEWSADRGTRVWCTPTSGGVQRAWAGVPRQLAAPGESAPRCVCVDPRADTSRASLQPYPRCPDTAAHCHVET